MAFTMSRGSPGTPPHTPRHGLPVSWHAVVPDYPFRAGSAIRSRDISSRLCPLRGRYTSALHGAPTTTGPPPRPDAIGRRRSYPDTPTRIAEQCLKPVDGLGKAY